MKRFFNTLSGAQLRDEKGASAVEFALVLPMLLLILFAIIEFGWYLTTRIVLFNAVSAGARAGIKARQWYGENPKHFARTAVKNAFWLYPLPDGGIKTKIIEADENGPKKLIVQVSNLKYSPLTGYLPDMLLPEQLRAKAVMAFP